LFFNIESGLGSIISSFNLLVLAYYNIAQSHCLLLKESSCSLLLKITGFKVFELSSNWSFSISYLKGFLSRHAH